MFMNTLCEIWSTRAQSCYLFIIITTAFVAYNTGYTQKNSVVSKVNKKSISHLLQAQCTSAAATVQVSRALPAVRFSCLLRGQFPRWRRSRKRLSVCSILRCPDLWLQCSVAPCVFSKQGKKLTLHCNHRSGHLKTEHTESLFLLRRHLGNWPRSKHGKWTAGSARDTWTVAAADGVCCARVRWEINFLLTFETAPFFCVYPVLTVTFKMAEDQIKSNIYCVYSKFVAKQL